MPALVAGIHVFLVKPRLETWMAGTSPAMTFEAAPDFAALNPGYKLADFKVYSVMPALVAGIHVFLVTPRLKTWMAGTSPAMTFEAACSS